MTKTRLLTAAAILAATSLSGAAFAQTAATATTDLNIRSGPGPQYPVTGLIGANQQTTINGCLEGSQWCQVTHEGVSGWAYSDYLTAEVSGAPVVMTQGYAQAGVPVVTYDAAADAAAMDAGGAAGVTTGAVGGAIVGALVGGPVGAAIGGVAGAAAGGATGATVGAAIDPDPEVRTYVTSNPVEPVYLEGEVVVGAGVPEPVVLTPVPDYEYSYAYVNGQPVLIDPATRQIVYVVR